MSSDVAPLDVVFVSDLHAGPAGSGSHQHFSAGDALVALTASLIDDATDLGRLVELVVLGDGLHFPAQVSDTASALAVVDAIVRSHPQLVHALRTLLEQGHRVVVVPGNHDADLHRPAVQERLRLHIGQRLRFEPWIYYRPGQVYAEHGHQYHDINRISTLLEPFATATDGQMRPVLSSLLEGPRSNSLRTIAAILRDRRDRRGRTRYHSHTLRDLAEDHGLDHQTLVRLDRVGQTTLTATAARLAKKTVRAGRQRVVGGVAPPRDAYLTTALDHIDAILQSSGHQVPNLVFGHTHLARRTTRQGSTYLNCGTWSSDGVSEGPLPYVRLRQSSAELLAWNGSAASGHNSVDRTVAERLQ